MLLNKSIMIRLIFGFLFLLFFTFSGVVSAQISEGGTPMRPLELKSSVGYKVEMPVYLQFFKSTIEESKSENKLKSLQFAFPFDVNLTPANSGEWFSGEGDIAIWKLTIHSEGAYSINLIFDDFELPEGARLFIFSEKEQHLLGAFNSNNNSESRKFAVSPVAGDEITVQYEVPEAMQNMAAFRIIKVNHDYVNILKVNDRRPMGKIAGSCNIDINCENWEDWAELKNAVVRMIVNGVEVCTGVLVNNTAENQKPYVLSAAHCYDKWSYAQTTVYAFNYESPFCKPLDGDPSNSISGAVMKAQFDSLDFALAQLVTVPPSTFQPYYAGWNRTAMPPQSMTTIHHPQGDVKKIASDSGPITISSFSTGYIKNAFLKVARWDYGVTEAGSSGGPFFDQNKLIVGTLTGGSAVCGNPIDDYCNRFSMAWDYKNDSTKQLKYWLDPLKTGAETLLGKQFNSGENLCGTVNNLNDNDSYSLVPARDGSNFAGYWGGSNSLGITEVVEKFTTVTSLHLKGVSLGVGKFKSKTSDANSSITVKVYNGVLKPEELLYSQTVKTSPLAPDAMNYIKFSETVMPGKNFFVGFELTNIQPLDSFAVYQSLRATGLPNQLYLKINNQWSSFTDKSDTQKSMANIMELVVCNINDFSTDTPLVDNPTEILVYPNPVKRLFIVEAGKNIPDERKVTVFNLLGQECKTENTIIGERKVEVNMDGNVPGIYFVRLYTGSGYITEKISFVPW